MLHSISNYESGIRRLGVLINKRRRGYFVGWMGMMLLINGMAMGQSDSLRQANITCNKNLKSLDGKPISFYLSNNKIDDYSKKVFREGFKFANSLDIPFADSIFTNNEDAKPFYLFIFNQNLALADGALSELYCGICLKFFNKYPCEYFKYLEQRDFKMDMKTWTEFIGFEVHTKKDYDVFILRLDKIINDNCNQELPIWNIFKRFIYFNLQE